MTQRVGVGTGGGCIAYATASSPALGGLCDPFTDTTLVRAGQTETITMNNIPLDQGGVLVFDALYALADNSFNVLATTVDPQLQITLPAGVTFTATSGDSGGTPGGGGGTSVPEPGTLALMVAGLAGIASRRRQ